MGDLDGEEKAQNDKWIALAGKMTADAQRKANPTEQESEVAVIDYDYGKDEAEPSEKET